MMTDISALLAEYAWSGSEAAFRELVRRFLDLVYSTALRLVDGDPHLAQDVSQMVFVDLARQARGLPKDVLLGGWLHRDTCFVARKIMRGQRRRQARERQAAEMNAVHDQSPTNLARIAPILDEAINQLGAADRTAILLRFFENCDFRSVGLALGSNEDAAQKRVSRALDKLQALLKHRGVDLPAAALAAVLASEAVTAAPQGLAAAIGGSALAGAATSTGITLALLKVKLGVVGAILAAGLVVPLVLLQRSVPVAPLEDLNAAHPEAVNEPDIAALPETDPESGLSPRATLRQLRSASENLASNPVPDTGSFRPLDEILKGLRLSAGQAVELESKLLQDPQDLSARCQLLGYYSSRRFGSGPARQARQAHILWFIQNRPDLDLRSYAGLDLYLDGTAYSQAKALWLQQANANPQNPAILSNAAAFCLQHDRPLAEDFLKQAQALEPANPDWSKQLANLYSLDASFGKPGVANAAAAKALQQMENAQANTTSEQLRFYNLNSLTQMAFDAGEIEKAQKYATTIMQQIAQPQSGWDYGDAIHRANLVLGRIALRGGRIDEAKQYLLASAETSGSPVLGSFGPNMALAKELLSQGEKETVLEYFKRCGTFWKDEKLATWTEQVNQGWIPDFGANLVH